MGRLQQEVLARLPAEVAARSSRAAAWRQAQAAGVIRRQREGPGGGPVLPRGLLQELQHVGAVKGSEDAPRHGGFS